MNRIKTFEDLEVYQLSIKLAKKIYQLVQKLPRRERFNIIDQLIRAISSVGANIAEGFGRDTTKEFVKFLYNARGSLLETRHFLNLVKELNYVKNNDLENIFYDCNILGIKLNNLIKALKNKQ